MAKSRVNEAATTISLVCVSACLSRSRAATRRARLPASGQRVRRSCLPRNTKQRVVVTRREETTEVVAQVGRAEMAHKKRKAVQRDRRALPAGESYQSLVSTGICGDNPRKASRWWGWFVCPPAGTYRQEDSEIS